MAKNIAILGSTGSIGTQTLDVARNLHIKVSALAAGSNIDLLEMQAREFKPELVAVMQEKAALELKKRLAGTAIEVAYGKEGMIEVATLKKADTVVTSVVGIAGLMPTLAAIRSGKNIALANKETLVTAGAIVMAEAKKQGVQILPVDSEHSAIFQCLAGNRKQDVTRLIITASGGPFRGRSMEDMTRVTREEALKHPNWSMGSKITIDSATLMNKGLEVIEARWLFDMEAERIDVLVHPQSIIHSMVEYADGSVIAQMGPPDMRLAIQLALTWPARSGNPFSRLDLLTSNRLSFEAPDTKAFPCLKLAYEALQAGGTMPAAMNAANEVAVGLFLDGKIVFLDIPRMIEKVMSRHCTNTHPSLDDIIEVDGWARQMAVGGKS